MKGRPPNQLQPGAISLSWDSSPQSITSMRRKGGDPTTNSLFVYEPSRLAELTNQAKGPLSYQIIGQKMGSGVAEPHRIGWASFEYLE